MFWQEVYPIDFDEFKLDINIVQITCNIDGTNHIIDHQFSTLL